MPDDVYRDDPPPCPPSTRFRPYRDVFLSTLAWLPEVREPWLRALHDRSHAHAHHPRMDPFW